MTTGNVKISIIVPIYNVEPYLEKCLNSLVNQTLQEIEIILVNDASPDNSSLIMEQYKHLYPEKIRCIYLEKNIRQGGARNKGVASALGEYLLFIDSDDYVDLELCELLYNKALEDASDVVCCNFYMVEKNLKEVELFPDEFTGIFDINKRKKMIALMSVGPVAKIIRREIWMNHDIHFPEKIKFEDLATMPILWMYVEKLSKVNLPLYYYVRHEESTTMKKNSIENYDIFNASIIAYEELIHRGFSKMYQKELEAIIVRGFMDEIKYCLNNQESLELIKLKEVLQYINNHQLEIMKNPYCYLRSEPLEINAAKVFFESLDCFVEQHHLKKLQSVETNYFDYYIKSKEIITKLLEQYEGYKIAIWGAGKKGIDFLQICDPEHTRIQYVIDKDPKKWGTILDTGHAITPYEEVAQHIDVIFIMNRFYYSAIKSEINHKNIEINNLKESVIVNLDVVIIMESCYL